MDTNNLIEQLARLGEQIDALPDLLLEAWAGLPGLPCL